MPEATPVKRSLEHIRGLALDVDGVLTDGGLWWGPDGEEWKRFHFADIMGLSRARRAGLKLALISGAPRSATVVATTASQLLMLDIADFRYLAARYPDLTIENCGSGGGRGDSQRRKWPRVGCGDGACLRGDRVRRDSDAHARPAR